MTRKPTALVVGSGRCGSSLVMQMLEAGGCYCTGEYPTFEDMRFNGMGTQLDTRTLAGKAHKVIYPSAVQPSMVEALAKIDSDIRIIHVVRDPRQQAKSYVKFARLMMGLRLSGPEGRRFAFATFRALPEEQRQIETLFTEIGHFMQIKFETIILDPAAAAETIAQFLGGLDSQAMAAVVRKRSPACYPGLLEARLLTEELAATAPSTHD